jgi:endonuclease/exonuclease/phosphatase family metal-dependent hydrolase
MKQRIFVILFLSSLLFLTAGCDGNLPSGPDMSAYYDFGKVRNTSNETNTSLNVTTNISDDNIDISLTNKTLIIGSFNVQIYGQSKSSNEFVMDALGDIIDDYDLLGFQEIRDSSQTAFPKLMREELPAYNYRVSDRLGRTSSKEQYAFIYNPKTVTLDDVFVYDDKNDVFEREPFIGRFSAENYSFSIILIHVKPTDAQQEIKYLAEVVNFTRNYYQDNDVFLMGDLNADCSYYEPGTYLNNYVWVGDDLDTTTSATHCAYDRIITYEENQFIIGSGVDRFDLDEANNEEDLVKAISDHYPVYVELKI